VSEPLLRVTDLHVQFPLARGVVRAVDGASFELQRGEALGLVGESGSGKTIALRALVGLLPRNARIAAGSIEFDGVDVLRIGEDERRALRGRSIAMVFQEPMTALNPVMRVGDQIPDAQRRADAYPHELSGGLRQRVMIAIAISANPKLILCDEPTTALDVTIQDQILKLLLSLRDELAVSLVFVSHDLAVIAQTCRRVAVMYAGQVVETGEVEAVFREPRHPYTLGLLRAVPNVDVTRKRLASIPGMPPDPAAPPPGCPFHPRCPFAQTDCTSGAFPVRPLPGDRATACIHHDVCAEDIRREPVIANG
jgi:oligopeptide/dipeptide ABC transporter ATP-binding protein